MSEEFADFGTWYQIAVIHVMKEAFKIRNLGQSK